MKIAALVATLLLAMTGPAVSEPVADAQDVALYLAENPSPIVVLGEVHDNPQHHLTQAQALASLQPKAVVFEMLSPEQAAAVQGIAPTDSARLARALDWANSGWPDFRLYAPVFAQVPKGGIRGAALPRDVVRRAMTEGAAKVFGPEAGRYGLTRRLSRKAARQLQAEIAADHCGALPDKALPGMIEAQRLRDAAFARATLKALQETGGPVALITGSGHARKDRGVPAYLSRVAPKLRIFVLGQGECNGAEACRSAAKAGLYDMIALTGPVARPDPCAAFRK